MALWTLEPNVITSLMLEFSSRIKATLPYLGERIKGVILDNQSDWDIWDN